MAHSATKNGGLMHAKYGTPINRRQTAAAEEPATTSSMTRSYTSDDFTGFGSKRGRLSAKEQRSRSSNK